MSGTNQLEMISCGNCKKCLAGGKVHGPYWYHYKSVPADNERKQKTISTYLKAYAGANDKIDPSPKMRQRVEDMRKMSADIAELSVSLLTPEEGKSADEIVDADVRSRLEMRAARKADNAAEREQRQEESKRIKSEVKELKKWLKAQREADGRVQPSTYKGIKDMLPKLQRRVKNAKKASREGS